MNVLVFGPSGSGKTYLSYALQKLGVNAYDGDDAKAWHPGIINKGKK